MKKEGKLFVRSVQTFIGSMIGVGIFGLPFVFAQSGYLIGLAHLIVIGLIFMATLVMYADVVINTPGHKRLAGLVGKYVGRHLKFPTSLLQYTHSWGAMLAYVIIGGEFVRALLQPWLGGELVMYQIGFGVIMSGILIGGLGFVSRIEGVFVASLVVLLLLMVIGSIPFAEPMHLTDITPMNWFAPFGVTLFALGGIAVIPEASDVLGRYRGKLRRTVWVGMSIVLVIYALFTASVLAVSGPNTSEEAILGLGEVIGPWAVTLGAVIGLFSVFTSYLILGVSVMDGMIYDYRMRYLPAWFITVFIPLLAYVFGARDFIEVVGFTGAILGGCIALLVIYLYEKARRSVCLPKRCLILPKWIAWFAAILFLSGILITIVSAL